MKKRWFSLVAILAILPVALSGCSSVDVTTDYDQSFDFTGLKSFAIANVGSSGSDSPAGVNPLVLQRFQNAVRSNLTAKGFVEETMDNADFLVAIYGGTQQNIQLDSGWGYGWGGYGWGGYGTTAYTYDTGTVVFDMVDPQKKQPIWRGVGEAVIGTKPPDQEKVDQFTAKILQKFPPAGSKS